MGMLLKPNNFIAYALLYATIFRIISFPAQIIFY